VVVLAVTLVVAVLLRMPLHVIAGDPLPVQEHRSLAAAIGLAPAVPPDAAVATWVYSLLYSLRFQAERIANQGFSAIDFCAGFLHHPASFALPARFASVAAGVAAVLVLYLLVSTLLDPVTGVAAAFVLAVHPAAVALSHSLDSRAFCLLLILCGLLGAVSDLPRAPRLPHWAVVGLCLGFATDAFPVVLVLFAIVLGAMVSAAFRARHRWRYIGVPLACVCFGAAALATRPQLALALPWHALVGFMAAALWVAAAVLVFLGLRSLRAAVPTSAYSSLVLFGAVVLGASAVSAPDLHRRSEPDDICVTASRWMVENLPPQSIVLVDSSLAESVSLPRNAASWRRELDHSSASGRRSRIYAAVALRAAGALPGTAFDVAFAPLSGPDAVPIAAVAGEEGPTAAHYLVVPDTLDLSALAADGLPDGARLWLVARFRSHDASTDGVSIWGTASTPAVPWPAHVRWLMKDARRLAMCPSSPR